MKIGIFGSKNQKKNQIEKILSILSKEEIFIQKKFYDHLTACFGIDIQVAGFITDDNFCLDMALSIGGDGTFLRTAASIGKKDIPIVGINTGRLGFLADISEKDLDESLQDILIGKFRIEERSLLELTTENKTFEGYNFALNEIAVLKQDTASMITIHATVNNKYLTSYQADGLIIATPTGSTAYSMSVGGPIITPDAANIILSPIAPHSLTTRPLVITDNSSVILDIESRNRNFLVSLDGRSEIFGTGTRLNIKKADFSLKVVKRIEHTFFETLREKLMWGADPRLNK